jgi:hypothetical protein
MKLSVIARYWAARELTRIERVEAGQIAFQAPFACPQFTIKVAVPAEAGSSSTPRVQITAGATRTVLSPVTALRQLKPGTFHRGDSALLVCFDLAKGSSRLELGPP